ncbi:MAG: hypothetical protein ABIG44_01425 [Planctomycetota bacterium]
MKLCIRGRMCVFPAVVLLVLAGGCPPPVPEPDGREYKLGAGPYSLSSRVGVWHDVRRLRIIPYEVFAPEENEVGELFPVIVFSHGLGSAGADYSYLGRYWASHGYVVVLVDHPGTDRESLSEDGGWMALIWQAIMEVSHRWNRPLDISFALDRLAEDPQWRNLVNMQRIGVAGHSFGAHTALAMIGMHLNLPSESDASYADARISAAVGLSPPGVGTLDLAADAWDELDRPCMTMMGTLDVDPATRIASKRRAAYEHSRASDQYLVTLQNATHGVFLGYNELLTETLVHDQYRAYIEMLTLAFFDAYLKGSASAQTWLQSGSVEAMSADNVTVEYKDVIPLDME